jgi:glycosyltransferase involved in cell wall biosynthesis
MARLLKSVAPDLTITYNWGAIDTVLGAELSGFAPVIHTEDGFNADEAARLKPRRVIARHVLLNRIALTVVVSKTLLSIARDQYKLSPGKVRFIPNGVDTDHFQPQPEKSLRRQLGISGETLLFGYIGRLGWEKNLPWLVRTFCRARLDGAKLILVGEGPARPPIEAVIQELGAHDRVILAGSSDQPAAFVAAFDALVMSSFTEQASLALLEAMASGLPVVSTDVGDSRDMLVPGQSRFVVPVDDEAGYIRALRELAANPGVRSRLGSENRARCVEVYSLSAMIAAYRDLYRDVIARRGA